MRWFVAHHLVSRCQINRSCRYLLCGLLLAKLMLLLEAKSTSVKRKLRGAQSYAATSAYASIASMPFLFLAAIGMMSLLAAIRSVTLANFNSKNVLL